MLHIHGSAFGAVVGLILAARHPKLVDRLILSCFLARYDNAARMMRAAFCKTSPEAFIAAVGAIERSDLTPFIPLVNAKTLLIGGREDNMSPTAPAASGVGFNQIVAGIQGNRFWSRTGRAAISSSPPTR